jgi:hypothetical protein
VRPAEIEAPAGERKAKAADAFATEAAAGRSRFNLIECEIVGLEPAKPVCDCTSDPHQKGDRDPRLRFKDCPLDIRLSDVAEQEAAKGWQGPVRLRGSTSTSLGLRLDHVGQVEALSA